MTADQTINNLREKAMQLSALVLLVTLDDYEGSTVHVKSDIKGILISLASDVRRLEDALSEN